MPPCPDPRCAHASPRPKNRPVILWYYCDVRARDIYNERDCRDCPSRKPAGTHQVKQEEREMPKGTPGFWDGIDPDTGRRRIEIARELRANGMSIEQIAKQLGGPPSTLYALLAKAAKPKPAPAPPTSATVSTPPVKITVDDPKDVLPPPVVTTFPCEPQRMEPPAEPAPHYDRHDVAAFLAHTGLQQRFSDFCAGRASVRTG